VSNRKGSAFERSVARDFCAWAGDSGAFWRSPGSGARARVRPDITEQHGDIIAYNARGEQFSSRFVVECKHHAALRWDLFLLKQRGKLYGFWSRLVEDACALRRRPMLIARQSRFGTFVVLDYVSALVTPLIGRSGCYVYDYEMILGVAYDRFVAEAVAVDG